MNGATIPHDASELTTGIPVYNDLLPSKEEIWEISKDIQLNHPLLITITYEDGAVVALSEDLSLWTEGETKEQAIAYLQKEIHDLYKSLLEDADTLGPFPKKCLELLQNKIMGAEPLFKQDTNTAIYHMHVKH